MGYGWRSVFRDIVFLPCTQDTLPIRCPPAATAGICTKVLGSLRRAGAVCRKTLYAYHVELHASKYLGILLLYARLLSAAFVKFPPRKTPLIRL